MLDPKTINFTPSFKSALNKGLESVKGTDGYVEIVNRYRLKNKGPELLALAMNANDLDTRSHALQALLDAGQGNIIRQAIYRQNNESLYLIRTLGEVENKKNKDLLQTIVLDKKISLPLRTEALKALGRNWSGEDLLVLLAKKHQIPQDLKDSAAAILSNAGRGEVRVEAAKYLPIHLANAGDNIEPVTQLVKLSGHADAGSTVFTTYCSSCHQVNNKGIPFGPNLSEIGSKLSKEAMYTAILQPSAGISFGFEGYIFTMKDGSKTMGYIASQTADELSVKMIGGQITKIMKSDITEQKEYGKSLMTEGLPQAMGQTKLVDLVEYLSTLKRKD